MPDDTYTMSIRRNGGAEQIVARGVSAARALMVALEYGGAGRTTIAGYDGPFHRFWKLLRYPPGLEPDLLGRAPGPDAEKIMSVLTLRSADYVADAEDAYAEFGSRFLSAPGRFWVGRFETDADFARRHRDAEA